MEAKSKRVLVYDTTLREGCQSPGISLSISDKIRIAGELDDMGVAFIEGGMPDTNPKEDEFYRRIAAYPFKNAEFVPFGATLRVGMEPENDNLLVALAETPFDRVCVYGKTDVFAVKNVLRTGLDDNLVLIKRTICFLNGRGKKVVFDCEGFFSGYLNDRDYSVKCALTAAEAGADTIVLCDSTGIADPILVSKIIADVRAAFDERHLNAVTGVHMHNDCGMADANTVVAALDGVDLVNTTLFGVGERAGNANFYTVIPNLQLRYGRNCINSASIRTLTASSYRLAELLNIMASPSAPFVGRNAFSHKAGTHINAVLKAPGSFEAIDPSEIGSERRLIASEMSGRSGMQNIVEQICSFNVSRKLSNRILDELKRREFEGYQYESAEASLELLVRRMAGKYKPAFALGSYKVITLDEKAGNPYSASAIVDLTVGGQSEITAGNGIGPVDALDCAFRRSMAHFYPETLDISLVDYKVRVIDSGEGTASKVRVFIEFAGEGVRFGTVGLSGDIIQASWDALVDAYEYWIMKKTGEKE